MKHTVYCIWCSRSCSRTKKNCKIKHPYIDNRTPHSDGTNVYVFTRMITAWKCVLTDWDTRTMNGWCFYQHVHTEKQSKLINVVVAIYFRHFFLCIPSKLMDDFRAKQYAKQAIFFPNNNRQKYRLISISFSILMLCEKKKKWEKNMFGSVLPMYIRVHMKCDI